MLSFTVTVFLRKERRAFDHPGVVEPELKEATVEYFSGALDKVIA